MTKKVVLVLVEGEAEEVVLTEFLDEIFGNAEVFIDVQRGDILTDWKRDKNIKITICDTIKAYLRKTRFQASDLKLVFQITDSDGAFIPNDLIKIDDGVEDGIFYDEDAILVRDEYKKRKIERRNEVKVKNINILSTINEFNVERLKIPYKIYYFSTNLDHVLWNERNENHSNKIDKAEKFIEQLDVPLEEFLWTFCAISKDELNEESDKESWSRLATDTNSLKRLTNVPLLFELARQL